ncbi:hypothetical protein Vretifemale_14681, partial [Volvox reticuliferus]
QMAREIAVGLQYLHEHNIIHGDLNPANVLLRRDDSSVLGYTAKIADFGLSVHMQAEQSHVSNTKRGTPFYTAPEVTHAGNLTRFADVFSYGVVLWELYCSRSCWMYGPQGRLIHQRGFPHLPPSCPRAYATLVSNCMQPAHKQRPSFKQIGILLEGMLREIERARQEQVDWWMMATAAGPTELTPQGSSAGPLPMPPGGPGGFRMLHNSNRAGSGSGQWLTPQPLPPAAPLQSALPPTISLSPSLSPSPSLASQRSGTSHLGGPMPMPPPSPQLQPQQQQGAQYSCNGSGTGSINTGSHAAAAAGAGISIGTPGLPSPVRTDGISPIPAPMPLGGSDAALNASYFSLYGSSPSDAIISSSSTVGIACSDGAAAAAAAATSANANAHQIGMSLNAAAGASADMQLRTLGSPFNGHVASIGSPGIRRSNLSTDMLNC